MYAQGAEQSGLTNLTNIGVQTQKFAKDFNDYTKDLPTYLEVRVEVSVDSSKIIHIKCLNLVQVI